MFELYELPLVHIQHQFKQNLDFNQKFKIFDFNNPVYENPIIPKEIVDFELCPFVINDIDVDLLTTTNISGYNYINPNVSLNYTVVYSDDISINRIYKIESQSLYSVNASGNHLLCVVKSEFDDHGIVINRGQFGLYYVDHYVSNYTLVLLDFKDDVVKMTIRNEV